MSSTRISRHVNAPRATVYRALLDARAVATWMVPTGMTSHVHAFDGREGGSFRISLTYDEPTGAGKTTAHTDTFHGRFVRLVPNEQVVEVVEFDNLLVRHEPHEAAVERVGVRRGLARPGRLVVGERDPERATFAPVERMDVAGHAGRYHPRRDRARVEQRAIDGR